MEYVIFHEKCASFSLAMESVILQRARMYIGLGFLLKSNTFCFRTVLAMQRVQHRYETFK
ncbi:hypothetical protein Aaci_0502 [Alicyclobacillus acidocaldarius subsp. acidocaldarius DSM 446]|uniref:Uncharacterized protein n=1 Tax=Alicyclobacillus acidocaldarius subsp. acidocaldarius (strain ATCC 27009 / DSM 446 / BCRC 14685 / JCM 5260 / KCTC 1825 / NBRC 15652 / NCIMB 11725 / NRRL B-14509 / 104-IA) TaxID=521098 RepID=C8WSQ4_ALIAD|nr:hypothetical protein Aaci_0502 [Alicyclobacillus acidocaldarius subsp. acidocaldarius DSM 446]